MEPRYTIGLGTFAKTKPTKNTTVPIRGPYASEDEFEQGVKTKPFRFTIDEVESWTDVCAFPLFPPSELAIEAFDKIQQAPRLDSKEAEGWTVVPYRTGITSSNCEDEPNSDRWPVYKGSSFDIWDPETGDYYGWGDVEELTNYLSDKRERSRKWPDNDRVLPCYRPTVAFRRVTNRTNRRTTIASLIPPEVFMRDADPFLLWESGDEKDEAYLVGILSSIPLDWFSRRFVEKHLDYYIFNGLPVPRANSNPQLRQRVIELSGRLAAVDQRYADWADTVGVEFGSLDEEVKQEKIYELDAVVAHLYGLTREHVEVIFETFHDGWDHEERLERVLDYYASWAERLDLDHTNPEAEQAAGTGNDD
ncbi:hypothetical protein PM022_09845 [Halorubrum ezzemoulense]|uniref:hypothetical protein n=1 Tax=Halorubrum ezzemoulense TaxID=337243 RepID=UPI00232AB41E|nr:hypothetical protein [Halorubrum ezzemoulense]MDB2274849.1 hypothetical protein [Halorubrum ezzemoulense]